MYDGITVYDLMSPLLGASDLLIYTLPYQGIAGFIFALLVSRLIPGHRQLSIIGVMSLAVCLMMMVLGTFGAMTTVIPDMAIIPFSFTLMFISARRQGLKQKLRLGNIAGGAFVSASVLTSLILASILAYAYQFSANISANGTEKFQASLADPENDIAVLDEAGMRAGNIDYVWLAEDDKALSRKIFSMGGLNPGILWARLIGNNDVTPIVGAGKWNIARVTPERLTMRHGPEDRNKLPIYCHYADGNLVWSNMLSFSRVSLENTEGLEHLHRLCPSVFNPDNQPLDEAREYLPLASEKEAS